MFKGLKERLDRWVIGLASRALAVPRARPELLGEAEAMIESRAFMRLAEGAAKLRFEGEDGFRFESPVRLRYPEVNRARGRLFRAGEDWRSRPLMLVVHGWNAELQYRHVLPRIARRFTRLGINAAVLLLPFHGERRPRQPGAVRNFISDDIPLMLAAAGQAVAEMNALLLWARAEGMPAAGLWGFSLGGWLAGLHVCASAAQDIALLTTPVSDMPRAVEGLAFCEPIRAGLDGAELNFDPLNLSSHSPKIPPRQILITRAEYDQFVTRGSLEELEAAWGGSECLEARHGHISVLLSRKVMRANIQWAAERLGRAGGLG